MDGLLDGSCSKSQNNDNSNPPIMKQSVLRKHLIIWDWDDTIFPTYSFRTRQDIKDKKFISKLTILVDYICKIFTKMIKLYGSKNIIIVTNASPKWINKCLNVDIVQDTFMRFQMLLKTHKIETISASTPNITSKHPHNHYKWKEIVFRDYFAKYFNMKQSEENRITSIGDSLCEYKASYYASKHIANRILNRVRLKPNPSINDMIFQFKHILSLLNTNTFCNYQDIDIDFDYSSTSTSSYSDTTSNRSNKFEGIVIWKSANCYYHFLNLFTSFLQYVAYIEKIK